MAPLDSGGPVEVSFSHVHFYADSLKPLAEYKKLESKLNSFVSAVGKNADVVAGRGTWLDLEAVHGNPSTGASTNEEYRSSGQDIVEQLLVGLGWRVTGVYEGSTRTVVVTSRDPEGVKFVITAPIGKTMADLTDESGTDTFAHFGLCRLSRYAGAHVGRQGIAVLGFSTVPGGVDIIRAKYAELHPKLLPEDCVQDVGGARVLEVFAYYKGEKVVSDADRGTVIRFVEPNASAPFTSICALPGVNFVDAAFDEYSLPAFCDHWVSNVFSRQGFLDTLNDTLGFTPKVNFNAGVVAAGEAQIESTVTGNTSTNQLTHRDEMLKDHSQVYLPINNALSEVGHVHFFLQEIGQGVQHIASRVSDLAQHIQRANDMREMTGAGFSFLQIPRSYYGYLTAHRFMQAASIDEPTAERCLAALRTQGIVDAKNLVRLDATPEEVAKALPQDAALVPHVLRARYGNLYALLREHLSEESYLRIVRNNILVDIQGEDLLLQIFTSTVLQRQEGQEAPFLEFIERVCSECVDSSGKPCKIKPGCGGFGIRNFLTLFLSIEVGKASQAKADAESRGDEKAVTLAAKQIEAFTDQLDESNPVLTAISDAMTAEGAALDRGDEAEAQRWEVEKSKGNAALQDISTKYKELMKRLREEN
jgi:hypothetical protein